jgi:hypothetical protein
MSALHPGPADRETRHGLAIVIVAALSIAVLINTKTAA